MSFHHTYAFFGEIVIGFEAMKKNTTRGSMVRCILESLVISKTAYRANVPRNTVEELMKIQKYFLWGFSSPKIKHTTIRMCFFNMVGRKMFTSTLKYLVFDVVDDDNEDDDDDDDDDDDELFFWYG